MGCRLNALRRTEANLSGHWIARSWLFEMSGSQSIVSSDVHVVFKLLQCIHHFEAPATDGAADRARSMINALAKPATTG